MDITEGELIYYAHQFDPEFTEIIIIPISDAHRGAVLFSEKHFQRTLEFIKNTPNAYAILNGDLSESALRTSKGDIFKQVGTPQNQRDWMIDRLQSLQEKILAVTTGNHEERIYHDSGIDISQDIAAALGVPYRAEGIALKLSIGTGNARVEDRPYVFWAYSTHGYGGARTKSSKAVKVERVGSWLDADLYIMSHDHVVNAAPDVYLTMDNRTYNKVIWEGKPRERTIQIGRMKAHRKMYAKSNAYLKWGGYSESKGFPPTDMTTPVVWLLTPQSPLWQMLPDKPQQMVRVIV